MRIKANINTVVLLTGLTNKSYTYIKSHNVFNPNVALYFTNKECTEAGIVLSKNTTIDPLEKGDFIEFEIKN